jgi:hypothetical protein
MACGGPGSSTGIRAYSAVGVRENRRLASRLDHRQFGALVATLVRS